MLTSGAKYYMVENFALTIYLDIEGITTQKFIFDIYFLKPIYHFKAFFAKDVHACQPLEYALATIYNSKLNTADVCTL